MPEPRAGCPESRQPNRLGLRLRCSSAKLTLIATSRYQAQRRGHTQRLALGGPKKRIAFLVDWLEDPYQSAILDGAVEAARDQDATLVVFPGGVLGSEHENGARRNYLFDLVDPERFDGVVMLTGTLGNHAGKEQLLQFVGRFRALPICSIGIELDGPSTVTVDNQSGMREAIEHLIATHGHRRIAFIRGPNTNGEAELRYQAYVDTLEKNGIELDENLVTPGDFQRAGGVRAVELLLDERKIPIDRIDAIAGAADLMVMGARQELARRNLVVPRDVALMGFDDIAEARWLSPPLASVRQPLVEQGRAAVRTVLAEIAGAARGSRQVLSTELFPRPSCGCLVRSETLESLAPPKARLTVEPSMIQRRDVILAQMTRASRGGLGAAGAGWETRLFNALLDEMRDEPDSFLPALNTLLNKVLDAGRDVSVAHAVLSALRAELLAAAAQNENSLAAANQLMDRARLLTSDAAERAQASRRLATEAWTRSLAHALTRLSSTGTLSALRLATREVLPKLGITSFYLATYLDETRDQATLVAAFGAWGSVEDAAPALTFRACEVIPEQLAAPDRAHHFIVEPLFRDGGPLGYAVFGVGTCDGYAYELMREVLSAALGRTIGQEA